MTALRRLCRRLQHAWRTAHLRLRIAQLQVAIAHIEQQRRPDPAALATYRAQLALARCQLVLAPYLRRREPAR